MDHKREYKLRSAPQEFFEDLYLHIAKLNDEGLDKDFPQPLFDELNYAEKRAPKFARLAAKRILDTLDTWLYYESTIPIAKKYFPETAQEVANNAFISALKDGCSSVAYIILKDHLENKMEEYLPAIIDGMIKRYDKVIFLQDSTFGVNDMAQRLDCINDIIEINGMDREQIAYTDPVTQKQEVLSIDERIDDIHRRKLEQMKDAKRYRMTAALDLLVKEEKYEMAAAYRDLLTKHDTEKDILREHYANAVKEGKMRMDRLKAD